MEKKNPNPAPAEKNNNGTLISWIVGLFSGGLDPEREKRRQIKLLAKEFSKVRYKFYKPKGSQATTSLAKFFYEVYKVTANASVIVQNADKSQTLKNLCIESLFSDAQRGYLDRLTEDSIRERAKTLDGKTLAAQVKDDMVNFLASLDSQLIARINATYTMVQRFLRFISFDYYFVLKKFDSTLIERNFSGNPKFEPIDGAYITDDIKDFQEVALLIDRSDNWDTAIEVLKIFKNIDVVDRAAWNRIVGLVCAVNSSEILTLTVKHASQDPYYKPTIDNQSIKIVDAYTERLRTQVEQAIQKILTERRDNQIEKLTQAVFGTKDVQRTKNYNERANSIFSKKIADGYLYTSPINYLKAFLIDYFKKDVRELQELILIRGKWTTNVLSQQVSDTYYQIMAMSDAILNFDENLSEEKELGAKIRKAMGRVVDKDLNSLNALKSLFREVNDQALKLVNETSIMLISFGKSIKMVLDDINKKDHEIIINWKELESLSEEPLANRIAEVYKKFYYFIQLMQVFMKAGSPKKTPSDETPLETET
jgi:hypothetical protein